MSSDSASHNSTSQGLDALAALASAEGESSSSDLNSTASTTANVAGMLEAAVAAAAFQQQQTTANSALNSLTPNQLALLAAAGLTSAAAAPPKVMPPVQPVATAAPSSNDPKIALAMQNLAYYQMLQLQQKQGAAPKSFPPDQQSSIAMALAGQSAQAKKEAATVQAVLAAASMQPKLATIAPQPDAADGDGFEPSKHTKKQQKRAANRRSAQLSRKRKKLFVEELKEENDDLRRKEQILMSIPDLVVVFDSSGKLWFVSQSVSRFLNFTAQELQGTSFWDRICEDSMRLVKAAFMDSLAARTPESDTAPLGNGLWELRLVDKNGSHKVVTLNGVVHFAGDRPECVCSMRPKEGGEDKKKKESAAPSTKDPSQTQCVDPRQSVIREQLIKNGAIRISDSGNSTGDGDGSSESGSSDALTGTA